MVQLFLQILPPRFKATGKPSSFLLASEKKRTWMNSSQISLGHGPKIIRAVGKLSWIGQANKQTPEQYHLRAHAKFWR